MDDHRLLEMATSPSQFRRGLLIDAGSVPQILDVVADSWQVNDFEATDPAWARVAGLPSGGDKGRERVWLERPRGHSKTGDIAAMVAFAMSASRRKLRGVIAASDKDQAALQRDAIDCLVRFNTWLADFLEVQRDKVINRHTGSEAVILSNDVPGSYGLTPDFVIAEELTHWSKRDLWDSLFSSAAKRAAGCLLLVIANAGFQDSWQWELREAIRVDPSWYFSRLDGPKASWITHERLAEQQRLLPRPAFERLWLNLWVPGAGDALESHLIDAAFAKGISSIDAAEAGSVYAGGIDLSVNRDHSAFVVVGKNKTGRYRVARRWVWIPPKGGKIDQSLIEQTVLGAHQAFRFKHVAADQYQAEGLCQRLQRAGVPIETVPQSGARLVEQALQLTQQVNARNLDLPPDEQLERQLRRLRLEARSYGMRLVSDRSIAQGHGDLVSALSIALCAAKPLRAGSLPGTALPPEAMDPQFMSSERMLRLKQSLSDLSPPTYRFFPSPYPNGDSQQ
jgi:phage terminase large subunit-like protein